MASSIGSSSFDVIVIGSGIGGLSCAAALTRTGRKALVLERHFAAGGLTQTFSRQGFTWDVGLHYLGEMGPDGLARRILDRLAARPIEFDSIGHVYDVMHFPGGFEFDYARPQAALRRGLAESFSEAHEDIDAYFRAVEAAAAAGRALFSGRALPAMFSNLTRFWHAGAIARWWGRTTQEVLLELVRDARLRAVLAGQRSDYGPDPCETSFGIHATVTRHYFDGAYYPRQGAGAMADALIPVIEDGGGGVQTRAEVVEILLEGSVVAGVRLRDGTIVRCPRVVSDTGALGTVSLLPAAARASDWAREIASFRPSACHVQLYLGLEGDVRSCGATPSNHWFHDRWDLCDALWRDPENEPVPPTLFVSFPSLKSTLTAPGARHTAEVIAFTAWEAFAPWGASQIGRRPPQYARFKRLIEERLLAEFTRHFPALAPMIVARDVSTPLSTLAFTGALHGSVYGLEASPRRFLSNSLHAHTPVPGLYLAGQDVASAGVTGAMMGGVLAAAAVEPRVFLQLPFL